MCVIGALTLSEIVALTATVVILAYVVTTPPDVQRENAQRAIQTIENSFNKVMSYVSKRQEDMTNAFLEQVGNVNSGNDTPRIPCFTSWSAVAVCAGLVAAGVVGIHKIITNGGMSEDESNYHPITPIATLTSTPEPTSTWTPSPTITSTSTSTPTRTPTPTSTPTRTPTSTPILTPSPMRIFLLKRYVAI